MIISFSSWVLLLLFVQVDFFEIPGNGGGKVPDGGAGEPGDGGGEHLLQPGGKISNMFDFYQPNHFINIFISIDGTILLLECIWSSNHISEDLN